VDFYRSPIRLRLPRGRSTGDDRETMVDPIRREQIRTTAAAWRAATIHFCEQLVDARVRDEFTWLLDVLEDIERWEGDEALGETMLQISTETIQRLIARIQKVGGPALVLGVG
jgi:hypothetical protein